MTTLSPIVDDRFAMPQLPEGPAAAALGFADIMAMLRRRTLLIVLLFIIFSAAALGGYFVWAKYFPGYLSECLIECVSNIPDPGLSVDRERLRQEEHERFVMTQALLLKSPIILIAALKVNAVRETAWWKRINNWRTKEENQHLIELTDDLRATPVRGTNFLKVSMECRDRRDPSIIVNEVVKQWYDSVKQRTAEEFAAKSLETARAEADELDAKIEQKRRDLRVLAGRLPAGARQTPGNNITSQQVEQYGRQVSQLSLELAQVEQYRSIYNDPEGVAVTAEDRAFVEEDPQVAQLAQLVFLLEQQSVTDAGIFGAKHDERRQLEAQLAMAKEKLAELRIEKLRERREDIREAANTAYLNTQHALFLAQENLAKAEAALQDQEQLLFNYTSLEEDLKQSEEYRQELADYISSLSRVVRQQSAVKVNVAQPAIDPLERNTPRIYVLPVGFFLALLAAVGIAFGVELLDTSVSTSRDVVRHLGLTVLGAVPDIDDEEVEIKEVEKAVAESPHSMIAEAYRRVRTNLQLSAPADRQQILLVTSPQPEDGKTTVACNLAMAFAQAGKRVLLIDANFRRPGFQKVFGEGRKRGLSNILNGDGSLESSVVHISGDSLDILGSGPVPPNPAELLSSRKWREFLQEASSGYDQLIIDTAPVLLASDPLTLATTVGGVILVIRARQNSRGTARRAQSLLEDVGAEVFGAVLNAAQVTRGGYFREQLRSYYDYQTDVETSAAPDPETPGKPPESA